jgi:DNA repair protein RecO (recombination protein O)
VLKRTEGIVLKTTLFGEADLIVTYLTRDFGLLSVFARSPRKTTSRFGSSLEPLTHAAISFIGREDADLPRLTQSDILRPFHAVRTDVGCLLDVAEMRELGLRLVGQRDPQQGIFGLYIETLEKLDVERRNPVCFLAFKIRLLQAAGFAPRLHACGRCGGHTCGSGTRRFYMPHGSVLCPECARGGGQDIALSDGAVKFYRSLMTWPMATIDRVRAPERLVAELRGVIDAHVGYLVTGPLKSARMRGIPAVGMRAQHSGG